MKRKANINSHLSNDLMLKRGMRSIALREGDAIKVMRGADKGKSGKILKVDRKKSLVTVEGLTMSKADGTQKERWVNPTNLLVTRLNLQDPWRRKKLGTKGTGKEELEREAKEEIEEEDSDV